MLAVIRTGGKQYLVKENESLRIEKLAEGKGKKVTFKEILLIADEAGKSIKVGKPTVSKAKVEASVLDQGRARKIEVVKYKPKVRYHKVFGHRQPYSFIKIDKIVTA